MVYACIRMVYAWYMHVYAWYTHGIRMARGDEVRYLLWLCLLWRYLLLLCLTMALLTMPLEREQRYP